MAEVKARGRRADYAQLTANVLEVVRLLPQVANKWHSMDRSSRAWFIDEDWGPQMWELRNLGKDYEAGRLSADEAQAYLRVVAEVQNVLPMAKELGLEEPYIPPTVLQHVGPPDPKAEGPAVRDSDRSGPARFKDPATRPLEPTDSERERWQELGKDRKTDPDYMRYLQSRRSHESLSESGRRGYAETARKYGRDFAADILAAHRRDNPSGPERAMIDLLRELGYEANRDYLREHKLEAGVYSDFAWPVRKLAIEVHGGVHQAEFFRGNGMPEREEGRSQAYERNGWRVVVVTGDQLLDEPKETRMHIQAVLKGHSDGGGVL